MDQQNSSAPINANPSQPQNQQSQIQGQYYSQQNQQPIQQPLQQAQGQCYYPANGNTQQNVNASFPPVTQKKSNGKGCLVAVLIVIGVFVLFFVIGTLFGDDTTQTIETTEATTQKVTTTESTTAESNSLSLEEQFEDIGLTSEEAKEYAGIFEKLGIKEISNIEALIGTGIDNLQSFRCQLYDYQSLQVNFTVDKRVLCYVEIAGLPSTKTEFYISMFGNLKTKQVQTTTTVTMYDKWDDNGEIDNSKNPFLAVLDYENQSISDYTE